MLFSGIEIHIWGLRLQTILNSFAWQKGKTSFALTFNRQNWAKPKMAKLGKTRQNSKLGKIEQNPKLS